MKCFFSGNGQHIAGIVDRQLHAPSGNNIGHNMENERVFVDMSVRYPCEAVANGQLMRQETYHIYLPGLTHTGTMGTLAITAILEGVEALASLVGTKIFQKTPCRKTNLSRHLKEAAQKRAAPLYERWASRVMPTQCN